MSLTFRLASTLSVAMTLTFAVLSTTGAKAGAQDPQIRVPDAPAASSGTASVATSPDNTRNPGAQTLADVQIQHDTTVNPASAPAAEPAVPAAASLAELVDSVAIPANLPRDIECLAGAIYFEAKSESLAGQLAVGRVIVARTDSGHFPASYCGVVFQHAQFSFVRGGALPGFDRSSRVWRQAVKIALIADSGAWKSPAEGALFFQAARIGPVAGKARVARIDNHVFYR